MVITNVFGAFDPCSIQGEATNFTIMKIQDTDIIRGSLYNQLINDYKVHDKVRQEKIKELYKENRRLWKIIEQLLDLDTPERRIELFKKEFLKYVARLKTTITELNKAQIKLRIKYHELKNANSKRKNVKSYDRFRE